MKTNGVRDDAMGIFCRFYVAAGGHAAADHLDAAHLVDNSM